MIDNKETNKILNEIKLYSMAQSRLMKDILEEIKSMNRRLREAL